MRRIFGAFGFVVSRCNLVSEIQGGAGEEEAGFGYGQSRFAVVVDLL